MLSIGCGCPMRINEVTYGKLKTPLTVNGNLNEALSVGCSEAICSINTGGTKLHACFASSLSNLTCTLRNNKPNDLFSILCIFRNYGSLQRLVECYRPVRKRCDHDFVLQCNKPVFNSSV